MTEAMKLETTDEALRNALAWYGEQARLARLIHSEGDPGRWALAEDGGKRAREVLALSASPAGVVKPLEWITRENRDSGRLQSIAHTIVGTYAVTDCADLGYIELHERAIGKVSKFKTIEAAKDAAFADYSARIMSAIEPAGVGVETGGLLISRERLRQKIEASPDDFECEVRPALKGDEQ